MGVFLFPSPPVCCGQLLKEAVADKSRHGEVIQPYFDKKLTGRPHFGHRPGGSCSRGPRAPRGQPGDTRWAVVSRGASLLQARPARGVADPLVSLAGGKLSVSRACLLSVTDDTAGPGEATELPPTPVTIRGTKYRGQVVPFRQQSGPEGSDGCADAQWSSEGLMLPAWWGGWLDQITFPGSPSLSPTI